MRFSTLAFLALFAGLAGGLHRAKQHAREVGATRAVEADAACPSRASTKSLERELARIDRRYREVHHSRSAVERSLRELQDVVRRTQRDLCDSGCSPIATERRQNFRRLQSDLEEVHAGFASLDAELEALAGQRSALKARLALARAGVDTESAIEVPAPPRPAPERLSPLDALDEWSRAVAH